MTIITKLNTRQWTIIALSNFLLVGVLGLLMRLKIFLPIPWLDQQYLLHAHSHFAFSGWVTHTLMFSIIIVLLRRKSNDILPTRQQFLLWANLLVSYGMLISFVLQGYGLVSIIMATLSIVVSYFFAAMHWKKTRHFPWLRGSLLFLVVSSIGTFYLSYLMAAGNVDGRKQLMAVYFYLHFQYNGWFLFACMGLLQAWLQSQGVKLRVQQLLFFVFFVSCFPGYFLSVLWFSIPSWLYLLIIVAAVSQFLVFLFWLRANLSTIKAVIHGQITRAIRVLLVLVTMAFVLKLMLQVLSVFPALSRFAYGYRPIVIAYLHLVLLVIISMFLLLYLFKTKALQENFFVRVFLIILLLGIFANELFLVLQGLSPITGIYIAKTPLILALVSGIICMGILGILMGQIRGKIRKFVER